MAEKITNTYRFQVRAYEIDARSKATLPTIINYMQEAAWHNAAARGASVYLLHEQGVSWVLNRLRLEMFRYPDHLENLRVETWPSGGERFFAYRDYRIFDEAGELIGQATSSWIVFDLESRKLVTVPDFLREILKAPVPENRSPLLWARGKVRLPDTFRYERFISVRYHDLDINRHVNQAYYFQWVIEALPTEWLMEKTLKEIDVTFKAESDVGDQILSQAHPISEGVFVHQLKRGDTQLTVAQTVWEDE